MIFIKFNNHFYQTQLEIQIYKLETQLLFPIQICV